MIRRKKIANILHNQQGAVLLMLLVCVTLIGLLSGIAGSSWQTIVQRSKEADLLWKGNQIRQAISRYYEFSGAGSADKSSAVQAAMKKFPASLEELLEDPRALEITRHLRRLYPDPMTGEEWELILSPIAGGIMGVRSSATKIPFKQTGFAAKNSDFSGQQTYRDWQFVYQPKQKQNNKLSKIMPTTTSTGSPSFVQPTFNATKNEK